MFIHINASKQVHIVDIDRNNISPYKTLNVIKKLLPIGDNQVCSIIVNCVYDPNIKTSHMQSVSYKNDQHKTELNK